MQSRVKNGREMSQGVDGDTCAQVDKYHGAASHLPVFFEFVCTKAGEKGSESLDSQIFFFSSREKRNGESRTCGERAGRERCVYAAAVPQWLVHMHAGCRKKVSRGRGMMYRRGPKGLRGPEPRLQ